MRVIGLISGTSADGIDAALVDITGETTDLAVDLLAGITVPYPSELQQRLIAVGQGQAISMAELAELDDAIAQGFAEVAIAVQTGYAPAELIGSHGQTVYHCPRCGSSPLAYSLQLGRGALIAHLTQLPTISNFRAADIAAGGEGAPLVSAVDQCLLAHPTRSRVVQNIGGISNLTYLPPQVQPPSTVGSAKAGKTGIIGWDTGPGNSLLDLAVQQASAGQRSYDQDGEWAATGTPCLELVEQWIQHPYFHQPPPKSTGRELFGAEYLQQCWADAAAYGLGTADFLATLTELTAACIAHSYHTFLPSLPDQVLLCGGGSRNHYLVKRLQQQLPTTEIFSTDAAGLSVDFKEAIAFGVLAYWRWRNLPGNLPDVTGAAAAVPLGEIHLPAGGNFSPLRT